MSEYRKEISIAAVVGIIAAVGVGLFAITEFPLAGLQNNTTTTPRLLAGLLTAENVSCFLANGACNMTIVNSSSNPGADVVAVSCYQGVISNQNSTSTTWHEVSGNASGQGTIGIPAGSRVAATCMIPTSELTHQPAGSLASGGFIVKLLNQYYASPPGSTTGVGFEGIWT